MDTLFIRISDFDNSACIRKPLLPENSVHAWAIKEGSLKTFQNMYGADRVKVINVPLDRKVFAIDFHELDDYLTGEHDDMPELVKFDSNVHTINARCSDYQVVFI